MAWRKRWRGYASRGYARARSWGRAAGRTYRYRKGKFGFGMNAGFLIGLAVGIFGLLDSVLPAFAKQALMAFAVMPIRIGGSMGSQIKYFAQGFVLGMLVRPYVAQYLPSLGGSQSQGNGTTVI